MHTQCVQARFSTTVASKQGLSACASCWEKEKAGALKPRFDATAVLCCAAHALLQTPEANKHSPTGRAQQGTTHLRQCRWKTWPQWSFLLRPAGAISSRQMMQMPSQRARSCAVASGKRSMRAVTCLQAGQQQPPAEASGSRDAQGRRVSSMYRSQQRCEQGKQGMFASAAWCRRQHAGLVASCCRLNRRFASQVAKGLSQAPWRQGPDGRLA